MRSFILLCTFAAMLTDAARAPSLVGQSVDGSRSPVSVVSVSQPTVLYDTGRDGCSQNDFPDESGHAFRDPSGNIHLFFTTSTNREFVGPSFAHLKHTCDIAYEGALNNNPSAYDDNGWLTAFYADGKTIYALIHNEFHAFAENKKLCPKSPNNPGCAEVSISEAVSTDGGYHFKRLPGDHALVAAMPYRFQEQPHWFGYMNPSSIVKHGDDYYVLVSQIHPTDRTRSGVCVLHTRTISDPSSWRGWDGKDFTVKFVDPYRIKIDDPNAHVCTPLAPGQVFFALGSLAWSPLRQSYLLVARFQKWDQPTHGEVPGAYLFESKDLIHWSKPVLLLSDAEAGAENLYPSLIDPDSPDANFSTLGDNAILYTKTGNQGYKSWKIVARGVHLKQ
jgi:hypothetical protein